MPEQETSKEEKIYNLVIELEIAKRNKRDVVKAHNEEVKRIQAEIKELLTDNQEISMYHYCLLQTAYVRLSKI
jgi:uncharacterized metal-binding protein